MNLNDHLGDRFDLVKRSFLQWLAPCGSWAVHPMFTGTFNDDQIEAYSRILGVSTGALIDKDNYLVYGRPAFLERTKSSTNHLFLDPDTGLAFQLKKTDREHLETEELIEIAVTRPEKLALVYDQSFKRESGRDYKMRQTKKKLEYLSSRGLTGYAYVSEIALTLVSKDSDVLRSAADTLKRSMGLPASRRKALFAGPYVPPKS